MHKGCFPGMKIRSTKAVTLLEMVMGLIVLMPVQYVYPGPYLFNSAQTCLVTYTVPNTAGGQTIAP
jgi:competence protein ComGF